MKLFTLPALAFLVACQGATPSVQTASLQSNSSLANRAALLSSDECGNYDGALKGNGGRLALPAFSDGSFIGVVGYAPFNSGGTAVFVVACPGSENYNNVPVPPGYSADWVAEIGVSGNDTFTFGPAMLQGKLTRATTLSPKTIYYMYVYDSNNNLLESYKIGPKKRETLKFDSPFENGFVLPGTINIEIAHPSQ
jgi:hypothetical protein